jgi:hypothetical protein
MAEEILPKPGSRRRRASNSLAVEDLMEENFEIQHIARFRTSLPNLVKTVNTKAIHFKVNGSGACRRLLPAKRTMF